MGNAAKKILFEGSKESLPPPLKWAGGKRWLVPHLEPIFKRFYGKRLVEPFIGGMAIALHFAPEEALLNDANPHLINFYKQLKKGLVIKQQMRNEKEFFYKMREKFNKGVKEKQVGDAALFYYLNRTCYNGLCRFNNKGEFNVPFGSYSKINYIHDFSDYKRFLKKWSFTSGDFNKLEVEKSDILYVDPPYDVQFTKYSKIDFTWEDQERLVEWLVRKTCPIVASNQATDRILKLYKKAGFTISKLSAPRRISCTGNRERALEMLAFKNI